MRVPVKKEEKILHVKFLREKCIHQFRSTSYTFMNIEEQSNPTIFMNIGAPCIKLKMQCNIQKKVTELNAKITEELRLH